MKIFFLTSDSLHFYVKQIKEYWLVILYFLSLLVFTLTSITFNGSIIEVNSDDHLNVACSVQEMVSSRSTTVSLRNPVFKPILIKSEMHEIKPMNATSLLEVFWNWYNPPPNLEPLRTPVQRPSPTFVHPRTLGQWSHLQGDPFLDLPFGQLVLNPYADSFELHDQAREWAPVLPEEVQRREFWSSLT